MWIDSESYTPTRSNEYLFGYHFKYHKFYRFIHWYVNIMRWSMIHQYCAHIDDDVEMLALHGA